MDVDAGLKLPIIKKIPFGVDVDVEVDQTEETEEEGTVTITKKTVKEVKEDHETQTASVGGNENNAKSSFAIAAFGDLPIETDNASYTPSFLEWINPLW